MILTIEVDEKEANKIAYHLIDKSGDIERTAARWGVVVGSDGDAVQKSLDAEAAMLKRVAKSITKQVKR
jgi:hypothetical protein